MKQLIFIFLFIPIISQAQVSYSTKTLYRYDKEDGWVRTIESEWYTVNNGGDTTFWTEVKEDTQQEDPGIKKDTVATLIPNSVFKIGYVAPPEPAKEQAPPKNGIIISNRSTFSSYLRIDTTRLVRNKIKIKNTSRTKYKRAFRKIKSVKERIKTIHHYTPSASKPVEEIKAITYNKKLWVAVKANGSVCIVEAANKKEAIKKISSPYISITQFAESSILR